MKKIILTAILVLACFVMAYANSDSDPNSNNDAKELFEEKCNLCHTEEYATDIKNTTDEWRAVISTMKNAYGADMTDKESETIIEYLSTHYGK